MRSPDDVPEWRRRIRNRIGEDPVQYLDAPVLSGETESCLSTARARIRGIDDLEVARIWLACERRHDRGPRKRVVGWIEDRIEYLEEHGERTERMPDERDRRHRDTDDDQEDDEPEQYCTSCGSVVEERTIAFYCPTCEHVTRDVKGGESA